MTYEREQVTTLLGRLKETPDRLICITGPRQTGKTTMVRQALGRIDRPSRYLAVDKPAPQTLRTFLADDADIFTAPDDFTISVTGERDERWLVREWERARVAAERSERGFVLVVDEVQKIPGNCSPPCVRL